jgi:hypothetical protein
MSDRTSPATAPAPTKARPDRNAGQRLPFGGISISCPLVATPDEPAGTPVSPPALDDPLGDVACHLVRDRFYGGRFGQHHPALPRVANEAIGAAVTPHGDMRNRVDPKARLQAGRYREIEHIDIVGDILEYASKFRSHEFEAHAVRLAHVDDDVVTVGKTVLHLANSGLELARRGVFAGILHGVRSAHG